MALGDTRSAARLYSSLGVGTIITAFVLVPGYVPACGMIGLGGRILLLTSMLACATAFVECPRHHLTHKGVTLACFTLSAFLAVAFGGRYLISLLSDDVAVRVLLAYQRLGL